jgi:protein-disulfide isomerase
VTRKEPIEMADDRVTKNQRREEARLAALKLKEDQARKARRQRTLAFLLGAVLLIGVGVTAWVIIAESNQPELADVELRPAGSTLTGGIPVGPDGIAGETTGAADDAVTVAVYSDFMCPICASFEEVNAQTLTDLRESGDIILEYHPVSILDRYSSGTAYSTRSATAVALVAAEAPEYFVPFVDGLFAGQPDENTEGLTDAQIADIAREAGVPEELAATIESSAYLGTGSDDVTTYGPWVMAATSQASQDLDSLGTPTIRLNGETLDTEKYNWSQEGVLAQAIEDARG